MYRAVEALVSYDRAAGSPVAWRGCGELCIVRVEELAVGEGSLGLARIVTMLGDACRDRGNLLGVLEFGLVPEYDDFSPRVERVLALRDEGEIEDVTSVFGPGGSGVEIAGRQLALRPTLELLPNPSAGLALAKFRVPMHMGEDICLSVYDVRGRLLGRINDGANDGYTKTAEVGVGRGKIPVPGPGVYFMRLTAEGKAVKTEKLVLLR